jgi:hypothetical protein
MAQLMDPVFDNRVALFGIPANVLVLAVAAVFVVAGCLLLRRISRVDPEAKSFRATDRLDATGVLTRAVALGAATFVLVLGALLLLR